MTPKEILKSVPTDAPSSTSRPKNNLWSWVVGVLTIVGVVLFGVIQSNHREAMRGKDATIQVWMSSAVEWRRQDSVDRLKLEECKDENTRITAAGTQQLLDYLDIKPGKKQTISISPKQSTDHE